MLGLMLPGIDGLKVCRLRKAWDGQAPLPVLMLTALRAESDRVLGPETGADDYVTKPFSPREPALRVGAVLRRASGPETAVMAMPAAAAARDAWRSTWRPGEPARMAAS